MPQPQYSTSAIYHMLSATVLDLQQITEILPHRHPFLLLDKVSQLDKRSIVGVKHISSHEYYFKGHFPEEPIMPGVLQVEALAQAASILLHHNSLCSQRLVTYLVGIDQCKFSKKVAPGDTLVLYCELAATIKHGIGKVQCSAFVDQRVVCEALLTAKITTSAPPL